MNGLVQRFNINRSRASPSQSPNTMPSSPSSHRSKPPSQLKARVSYGRITKGQPRQWEPETKANEPKQRKKRPREREGETKRRRERRRTLRLRARRRRRGSPAGEGLKLWVLGWSCELRLSSVGSGDLGIACQDAFKCGARMIPCLKLHITGIDAFSTHIAVYLIQPRWNSCVTSFRSSPLLVFLYGHTRCHLDSGLPKEYGSGFQELQNQRC